MSREGAGDKQPERQRATGTPIWVWVVYAFGILAAAIFWTWLWGPVGLLLSTPLTVCLVVLGRHG